MPSPPPFGLTPIGVVPVTALQRLATQPPGVLADAVDYGQLGGDSDSYQPTFEYASLTKGLHPIDEQVLIAHTRVRSSGAAVQSDGGDFSTVTKLTIDAPKLIESIVKAALARLVGNGDAEIISIKCVTSGDLATVTTSYRNLRARDSQTTRTLAIRVPVAIGVTS